jgi:hypothetical protein
MLLGIKGVINVRDIEKGRFYLTTEYGGEPALFQCIYFGVSNEPETLMALRYPSSTDLPLRLESLPDGGAVVALPDVHVRVDAPSLTATNFTSSITPGMFFVAGEEAFVAVPRSYRGVWTVINISRGEATTGGWRENWAAFSRWLFVIEDNGEEIPISSFGDTE